MMKFLAKILNTDPAKLPSFGTIMFRGFLMLLVLFMISMLLIIFYGVFVKLGGYWWILPALAAFILILGLLATKFKMF